MVGIIIFCAAVFVACYLYVKWKFSYWRVRSVVDVEPEFPYGNLKGVGTEFHISILLNQLYKQLNHKCGFGGIYTFLIPSILIIDLDMIKTVLVKDFQYFINRGLYFNESDDPLSINLVAIADEKWKRIRSKLSPTFTSGKMKLMFPTVISVVDEFKKCLDREISVSSEVEIRELLACFTTDVIGSCAFGLECNSLNDPKSTFRVIGNKVFSSPRHSPLMSFLIMSFPNIAKALHVKVFQDDVIEFFLKIVRDSIDYREKNNYKRNDFFQLLCDLQNHKIEDGDGLMFSEIVAQAFVFFIGGFETSSTTMAFCLNLLAYHQEIQNLAREEIKMVLKKHGGLTYEALADMKYLDQIINETLRMCPPGAIIVREVNEDYRIPNSNVVLEKGIKIFIPVYSIHHDPKYYPEPEKFDPDRFSDEEIKKRNPFTFLAFGEGPRNCIGMRFGMMQIRIGLTMLLSNFKFTPSVKSIRKPRISKTAAVFTPVDGVYLKVENV